MGYFRNEVTIYSDGPVDFRTNPENKVSLTTPNGTKIVQYGAPRRAPWFKQLFHIVLINLMGLYKKLFR